MSVVKEFDFLVSLLIDVQRHFNFEFVRKSFDVVVKILDVLLIFIT